MLNIHSFDLNFFSICWQITALHIYSVNTWDKWKSKQRNLEGNHKRENLLLVFTLRHKILKSKFNRPAKLSMPLGVRWTKNIPFCKFPAWLCPSFLKQSILNIWFLRPVWYQAECRDKVVLIQKRPFLQIPNVHSQCTYCCLCKSIIDYEPKVVAINSKIKFQMVSLTSWRPYLCPSEGHKINMVSPYWVL